jgi:small conductance mechanosensitive channel
MKTQKYFKHPTRSFVKNLTDSAIELAVRPKKRRLWCRFTETLENCKTAFDAAGIVIQPIQKKCPQLKN